MSTSEFALAPYPGLPFPDGVRLTGRASRAGAILRLDWRLEAPAGAIALPAAAHPERRRGLWEETCFEFFLASPQRPGFWEFNLSPAGHWNVFRFEGYRAGMADEKALKALPFSVATRAGVCEASLTLDTAALGLAIEPWQLAVSTVVQETTGRVSYWALSHPGSQPDFHLPDAFQLQLADAAP